MTLKCGECGLEIKFGKTVWFMEHKHYHPECVQDNPTLYAQWKFNKPKGNPP
jgi:hypothetical protein